ncbi:MAG TPA: cytochrome P450, partial [Acidimicrobiales bacterium]|nr:cytochrome P450 [Acidimicrobiales bacterium]
ARARADDVIRAAIARRRAKGDDVERTDVLAWLLDSSLSEREVLDQVVSLIAAGYGTTSAAVGWAVLRVLERPDVVDRLRTGDDEYLDAVVQEVLRLHPPGAVAPRHVDRDVVYKGHRIERGSTILYSALVTHRMPEVWDDPLSFRPERWLGGFEPVPYSFVAFGGGYRRCIGFAMATMEIKAAVRAVVARDDVALVPAQRIVPKGIGAMYPSPGVRVRVAG